MTDTAAAAAWRKQAACRGLPTGLFYPPPGVPGVVALAVCARCPVRADCEEHVAGLSDLPRELIAQGTAVRSLAGQVAGAVAVGIVGAVIAIRSGIDPSPAHVQAAYNAAFLVASLGVALALLCAIRLPRTSRADRIASDVATPMGARSGCCAAARPSGR